MSTATPRAPISPCKGEVVREADGRGSKFSRTTGMTKRARSLRANMTDAEARLWRAIRRDQINGFSFRRQHPVGPYTLDFYCPEIHLAIELDGGQHAEPANQIKDRQRTAFLESKGILVIRFWNNDVLANLAGVLSEIVRVTTARSPGVSTPSPTLPLSGGGRTEAGS